jgi:hypothetical protein
MNEQQRLYLVQARSDWTIFQLLSRQSVCQQLHYLQMVTEKLGKAFFWKGPGAENLGHAAFSRFVRAIATNRRVAELIGFPDIISFREWCSDVSILAYALERLAPAIANDGPNPEYPWPRAAPRHAPVEHQFDTWEELNTRNGHCLRRLVQQILVHFERLF